MKTKYKTICEVITGPIPVSLLESEPVLGDIHPPQDFQERIRVSRTTTARANSKRRQQRHTHLLTGQKILESLGRNSYVDR